jgi:diaminopimelate epimerase
MNNTLKNITIVSPNGNITALVPDTNRSSDELFQINNTVLATYPTVEQVAFYDLEQDGTVKMRMAGNELCVNGLRALSFFALNGKTGSCQILVENIGEFLCGVDEEGNSWIELPLFSTQNVLTETDSGVTQVDLPGMTHLLIPLDENFAEKNGEFTSDETSAIFTELASRNLDQLFPAAGVMYYRRKENKILLLPIVWVRDIQTFILENACGSGTLALVGKLYWEEQISLGQQAVIQFPSGEILYTTIFLTAGESSPKIRISGQTALVNQK